MIKTLNVGHVFGLFHIGNMPDWKVRRSSKLFAEKVMPQLRDVWPDWKDDDRWWIKPYEGRVRAEDNYPGGALDARAHRTTEGSPVYPGSWTRGEDA